MPLVLTNFWAKYNAKINEIKSEIPHIVGLATMSPLNAVKNQILKVSDLVKKQIVMQK